MKDDMLLLMHVIARRLRDEAISLWKRNKRDCFGPKRPRNDVSYRRLSSCDIEPEGGARW